MKNQFIILLCLITLLSHKAFSQTPIIASISPSTGTVGTSVTISGANFSGVTEVSFNGVAASSVTEVSGTSLTAVAPVSTSGNITVTTSAGTSNGAYFRYAAPTITSISPSTGTVGTSVTISGTNFFGVTGVSFNGVAASSVTEVSGTSLTAVAPVSTSGNITVTTSAGTSNGAYFRYAAPPTITSISPSTGTVGTSVTITGTNFFGVTGVSFNGVAASSVTEVSGTSLTAVAPVSTSGNITVTTLAGTSNGAYFSYAAPTITSISPSHGTVGTSVTIIGTNFFGVTGVSFNGVAASSVTEVSGTSITAVAPVSTSGNITVTTSAGTSNGMYFNYSSTITEIQPVDLNDQSTVLIYRNANNQITIQLQSAVSKNAIVTIFDTLGHKLEFFPIKNATTIVGKSLTSGVYIVQVTNGQKTVASKITI